MPSDAFSRFVSSLELDYGRWHDGDGYDPAGDRTQTAAALPIIIDRLRENGYDFSTLPIA